MAGGTSAAAPAFAGIVAIINQATNSPQGNINPAVYRLAGRAPSAFHDITSGGNQVSCRLGTTDCGTGGTIGYSAGPGYDQATGLGSVDASNLVAAWPLIVPSNTSPNNPATTSAPTTPSSSGLVPPQPISEVEQGNIRSGYVVITPDAGSTAPLPMATLGIVSGGLVQSQAAVLPAPMTTTSSLLVDVIPSIGRNLGIAVANPGESANVITLALQDSSGVTITTTTLTVPARQQVARFVTELFGSNAVGSAFSGSLRLQSQTPFSLLGLRFSGIEFSTLPVVGAATGASTAQSSSIILPQFAMGGGWASEIALVNSGTAVSVAGRVDIFDTSGNPMRVQLNNATQSTFRYSISPGGTLILAPRDVNGLSPL